MNKQGIEKVIPEKYKIYGRYVLEDKMLPRIDDGLLPVQRRILLSLHQIAKSSFVKTAQVLGYCMGHYHPHSEANGTAKWAVDNGFAEGGGQWGSKIGVDSIDAAAPRYTKIKINDIIEKTAFKYIKYVNWIESELDNEPEYIPTMFPFCLMAKYETSSIAFGFKTTIPVYSKDDLYKRLEYIIGERKNEPVITPIVSGCEVLSGKKILKDLLTNGHAVLSIKGLYKVDKINKQVIVQGWNPRYGWESVLKKIDKFNQYYLLERGDVSFMDESSEKNGGTYIVFSVQKLRNVDDIFNKLIDAIDAALQSQLSYSMYTVNDSKEIKLTPVDTMLSICYKNYTEMFKKSCEDTISNLKLKKEEYELIKIIKPYIKDCITQNLNEEDSLKHIVSKTKKPEASISNVMEKYTIRKLTSITLDIQTIDSHIQNMQNKLINFKTEILNEYKNSV